MREWRSGRKGFTLLELLLAISILALVTAVTFMTFSTVAKVWQRGTRLADDLHHGDFVIDQLVMAVRSAYYPEKADDKYGFWLTDKGSGEKSSDKISWVKLGGALVGTDAPFADSPHRVEFSIGENAEGESAVMIRAWRIYGQDEDFDPEEDVEPFFLSKRVLGFECRPAYPFRDDPEEEIEWLDEWEHSNTIPETVELTLFLEPLGEDENPIEVRRVVQIPVAPLSLKTPWPSDATPETDENAQPGDRTPSGGGAARPSRPATPAPRGGSGSKERSALPSPATGPSRGNVPPGRHE